MAEFISQALEIKSKEKKATVSHNTEATKEDLIVKSKESLAVTPKEEPTPKEAFVSKEEPAQKEVIAPREVPISTETFVPKEVSTPEETHDPMMNENDSNLLNAISFINDTKDEESLDKKPVPTKITVEEKRSRRAKTLLIFGIVILSASVLAILAHIVMRLTDMFL